MIQKLQAILVKEAELLYKIPFETETFKELVEREVELLTAERFVLHEEISAIVSKLKAEDVVWKSQLYGRIMRDREFETVRKSGVLVAIEDQLVPVFTGAPRNIFNVLERTRPERRELYRQMGGTGQNDRVIIFKSAELPVATQHFRKVEGLTQAFLRAGTRIVIVRAD